MLRGSTLNTVWSLKTACHMLNSNKIPWKNVSRDGKVISSVVMQQKKNIIFYTLYIEIYSLLSIHVFHQSTFLLRGTSLTKCSTNVPG